jgi:hypothetical protein
MRSHFLRAASSKGGGGGWTPADITTELWLDAADASTITLNGSDVSVWGDKSVNNNNFTQTTASSQPIYDTASLNGLATVRNDAGGVSVDVPSGGSEVYCGSVFVLTKHSTGTGMCFLLGDSASKTRRYDFHGWGDTRLFDATFGAAIAGDAVFRENGSVVSVASATKPTSWAILSIPRFQSGGLYRFSSAGYDSFDPVGRTWLGSYAEVIALPAEATTDQRDKIEGYLAHKWGLTANLPSGHPYKSSPP